MSHLEAFNLFSDIARSMIVQKLWNLNFIGLRISATAIVAATVSNEMY